MALLLIILTELRSNSSTEYLTFHILLPAGPDLGPTTHHGLVDHHLHQLGIEHTILNLALLSSPQISLVSNSFNSVTWPLCSGEIVATGDDLDCLVTGRSAGRFMGGGGPGDVVAGLSCG